MYKKQAKKMINPYYFTDRVLQIGFNITLKSHQTNHANSDLIFKPSFPGFRIEVRYINKMVKQLSVIYARILKRYKVNYQTVFSARFDEQDEDSQVLYKTDLSINLIINHNLKETDRNKVDIKSPLEHQIQAQEMKNSGWRFDKINSMTVYLENW